MFYSKGKSSLWLSGCPQVNHFPDCQDLAAYLLQLSFKHTSFLPIKQFKRKTLEPKADRGSAPISHDSLHGNSCAVGAKASLRNFNAKQKQKTSRGQRSKITSQSLVSPACFLLTISLRSLVPALQCVCVCVCVCIHI